MQGILLHYLSEFAFNAGPINCRISLPTLYIVVGLPRKLPKDSLINQFEYYYTRKCLEHQKKEAQCPPLSAQGGWLS
jgi:hypothetical protein